MTTTLFCGGKFVTLAQPAIVDWVLIEGPSIVATGVGDEPAADRRVDVDGATVVPAFCDAHVHLPATGLYAAGLDLRGERSARRIVEALAARAVAKESVLFGGNFEDPLDEPLVGADLDAAVGDRPALLARADMHSCVVSTALLRELDLDDLEGVDRDEDARPTGYLREQAAGRAWRWFERTLPASQQRAALATAAEVAYSRGVASVHEMYVVEWRGWSSLELVTEMLVELALDVVVYVATLELSKVIDMGLPRIGGDLFLDGSFGSHTAWMSEPYLSQPPPGTPSQGISYVDDAELVAFFTAAQRADLQVGVHAIGDAAIEQAIAAWERVAGTEGAERVRAGAHRIEHFECSSDDHMRRAAALGLNASVQPAFDRLWGGTDGMYARRLGRERAARMDRFSSMLRAGMAIGAGSDSTVTPLDPFLQMAALRAHHVGDERLDAATALRAHTVGSHRLARRGTTRGTMRSGAPADLVVLDRDPLETEPEELLATGVIATWVGGVKVWPDAEAEAA